MKIYAILILSFLLLHLNIKDSTAQNLTAAEIVDKANQKFRGATSRGEVTMTILRPSWKRDITMKSWAKGDSYSLILITAPARDKGTSFLKRKKEVWNWQPSIERVIKLPPSMMSQSWMGSDFTNDDLVRENSIVDDFYAKLLEEEKINDRNTYKIELIPKEGAAVVWGKIILWIDKQDFIELKGEFYDEDEELINIMNSSEIQKMGGRIIATKIEMIPADKPGHKTIIEYKNIVFDEPISDDFFSVQNMKRVK